MDSLSQVSLAIVLILSGVVYFVYKTITDKNKALRVENDLLKMKVKTHEVMADIQNTTIESIVNDRNGKRDKNNS
jgi:hypothetical protein